MLGRLFGYGTAPKYGAEAVDSDAVRAGGALYVVKADGTQICVYMSCAACVRPTAEAFTWELVVSRDAKEEADGVFPADVVFPVDNGGGYKIEGGRVGWCDRAGKRYNMDLEEEGEVEAFRAALAGALFEKENGRAAAEATIEELEAALVSAATPKPSDLLEAAGELLRIVGELYRYDVAGNRFVVMAPNVVVTVNAATVREDNSRAYVLMVFKQDSGDRIMECEVENNMNAQFYSQTLSLVWVLNTDPDADSEKLARGEIDPETQLCLSIKLQDAEEFVRFRNQFSVCLYEVNHQNSMDDLKLKDDDRAYVEDSFRDDVDAMDLTGDSDDEDVNDRRQVQDDDPKARATMDELDDGMYNSQLAVAANNDRTFVVRGDKMGVFKTGSKNAEFTTTVYFKDPTKSNARFNPSNVLLHEKDTSMLVLDQNDPTKMMRMDLERGEIVDTWAGGLTHNTPIHAVQGTAKYSNLTDTKEFVGLNKNQLLRMDPRTNEFIVQSKKYAAGTRAKLDCVATTGAGYLAVASENGDIRLFDQIGKNAKTLLPGLGDRSVGIDVSEDGFFVLVTTAKYLLIIDSRVKGEAKGGFQKSMGKKKPAPRKLTIKNEDIIKYRMGEINFTAAHFNTGASMERSIVTSTGPFIVTWNFRAIKLGRLDSYQVKRYQDNIVADNFAYDNDGRIVVTLPNDVSVARR